MDVAEADHVEAVVVALVAVRHQHGVEAEAAGAPQEAGRRPEVKDPVAGVARSHMSLKYAQPETVIVINVVNKAIGAWCAVVCQGYKKLRIHRRPVEMPQDTSKNMKRIMMLIMSR